MARTASIGMSAAEKDPDGPLVRALKCCDSEAFDELLRRYEQPIYAYISRLINDAQEAEDTTQDVFVLVFRKIGGFREECKFKTWLYRIAANEAANRRRWFSRHRMREVALLIAPDPFGRREDQFAHDGPSPYDTVLRHEQRDIVHEALRQLSPRHAEVLALREIAGLSYADIAEVLGVSMGTVKSRMLRAREKLKQRLLSTMPAEALHGAD